MTPEEQVKGFHEFMLGTLAKRQAEFSLVEAQLEKVVIAETVEKEAEYLQEAKLL